MYIANKLISSDTPITSYFNEISGTNEYKDGL
jgi:hypothetical protein